MADYAILCAGAWSVPIYPTLPAHQIAPLLNDCGAKAIFVSTIEQLGKVLQIKAQCPALDHVIAVDASPPAEPGYLSFHALADKGRPTLEMSPAVFEQRAARVKPEDVATIIYTSGTTGEPKGAMLTHSNFVSNVTASCEVVPITGDAVALSFLPLSHVFERMLDYAYLYRGSSIAYAESIDKLRDNFVEVNPHAFGAVPRVYEKVHARIIEKVEAGSGLKKKLFYWAVGVGRERVAYEERRQPLPAGSPAGKLADSSSFRRSATPSEPVPLRVSSARRSRATSRNSLSGGSEIYEGYGLTETSPVIAVNGPDAWRLGTVGKPLGNVEVKIAPDGEILTRGPHVMKGYFNKPEATAEAIDAEGWFHTGDIGKIDEGGFLVITDRKKDLIVLAGGKNVAPQPIENELKGSPFIGVPIVLGDRQKFIAAVIGPELRPAARARQVVELDGGLGEARLRSGNPRLYRSRSTSTNGTSRTTSRSPLSRSSPRT